MSNQQTIDWLRSLAENGGKGVVNNIDARNLGRIADELERLRAIAIERMDLFRQAASRVEVVEKALERLVDAYGSNNPSRDAPIVKDARRILRDVGKPK